MTLNIFLYTSAVFLLAKQLWAKKNWSEKAARTICFLGSGTLGVYVIHVFFVDNVVKRFLVWSEYRLLWLTLPALAAGIFAASFGIAIMLKKIPWLGKRIV